MRLAILGLGNISGQYLAQLPALRNLELVAVADLRPDVAQAVADRQGVRALTPEQLVADPQVEVVLNLTTPAAHAPTTIELLRAGKHVYQEKPFALTPDEATAMLSAAREAGTRLGVAPDTVLGTGVQTARAIIDAGEIGRPVSAIAAFGCPGHEAWHPNPAFYYAAGGGPMLDMGVYYLTALVTMLGPVEAVVGMASRTRGERLVPDNAPREGETIQVEVDTHVQALLRHANGALTTVITSFDMTASTLPHLEVHGEEGSLQVPDPNGFGGSPRLFTHPSTGWVEVADRAGFVDAGRGYGASDLVSAIEHGREPRQGADLGRHVFEVMDSILASAHADRVVTIQSSCERPAAVPLGSMPFDS
ncbi:Gfo/Idh/MocA family protein [Aestuariimicrobium kwangyangense]|uniref:Gfo/Idh/MocA family protein n=1 Tax=Aestuariimicrobium kwangyangense TaxID=396389 RepID=UPI00042193EE|nr:Gfo/Idh/MocA family oxidoreductase [Aestuariimicrobium kwangyangense]